LADVGTSVPPLYAGAQRRSIMRRFHSTHNNNSPYTKIQQWWLCHFALLHVFPLNLAACECRFFLPNPWKRQSQDRI
jgi:hypothetical protein